jgi:photosystem II stability/assembly factor-like uncharacterized protein
MVPACRSTSFLHSVTLVFAIGTTQMYGQPGADLRSPVSLIQADLHHKGTLLAGTATARLFRSRDGGDTWNPLTFPAESRSTLHALVIDASRPNVYWVAVSSEMPQFAGVFCSVDEGVTWQSVAGLERKQVWALVFWKVDSHVIAAGTEDGVYLTRDGGKDWTLLSLPGTAWPHPVVSLTFDPEDANTIYAGTPHLAWKTIDGGRTWKRIPRGMQEDSDIFFLDVDVRRRSHLFAAACSGIYRSLDGGSTWLSLERALGGAIRTYVVTRAPDSPDAVYAGTSVGLIVSPDSGATWYRLLANAARSLAFDPDDPHRIFVATDKGVLRIEDGGARVRLTGGGVEERRRPCTYAAVACRPRF